MAEEPKDPKWAINTDYSKDIRRIIRGTPNIPPKEDILQTAQQLFAIRWDTQQDFILLIKENPTEISNLDRKDYLRLQSYFLLSVEEHWRKSVIFPKWAGDFDDEYVDSDRSL